MRNFSVLSDLDFESVVADLIAAESSAYVERFARGADGGIDLRWHLPNGERAIAQCKHYFRSTFSQLLKSAKDEVLNVKALDPAEYRFYTSFDLSVTQKQQVYEVFSTWMSGPGLVFGGRDIDGALTLNSNVERRHINLWLSTGTELFWATNSEIASRSGVLRTRIERTLSTYVRGESYEEAIKILDEHRVCLIAGVPGIGKSALAQMLVASYITLGYQPIEVSEDIKEAFSVLDPGAKQIFLYDDFLGQISFTERMGKNEDSRLVNFIDAIGRMSNKKLVMTTREYILRDARLDYHRLTELSEHLHFILALDKYSRLDRVQILYSHLWRANVPKSCLNELSSGGWKEIVDHTGYNPRLIEYCTGPNFDASSAGYLTRFSEMLTHPEALWRNAYDRHLAENQRALLLCMASMPVQAPYGNLLDAYLSYNSKSHIHANVASFRSSLEVLEGTFISIAKRGDHTVLSFHSPSVAEFVLDQIREDPAVLASLISSAVSFEQLTILRNASGEGSSYVTGVSGGVTRRMPVELFGDKYTEALIRTFGGPSPVKQLKSGTLASYEDPDGLFEDRLGDVLDLPSDLRPPDTWIESRLTYLSERWKKAIGGKSEAIRVLRKASRLQVSGIISIPEATLADCRVALEGWLGSSLAETADWRAFVDFNIIDSGDEIDEEIRDQFLDHALNELMAWDPSPPDLDALVDMAELFGVFSSIEEDVNEAERRAYEQDDIDDGSRAMAHRHTPGFEDEKEIEKMFNRFTS
ncbi:restriction endonuclease [Nocardia sp. NPDC050718]|uniref:nSTAND3 domain-containing NTPase n=1 Tax=Nocardia sp. NPDC050718 TaxID=3155788 RepID=UPI0033E3BC0C